MVLVDAITTFFHYQWKSFQRYEPKKHSKGSYCAASLVKCGARHFPWGAFGFAKETGLAYPPQEMGLYLVSHQFVAAYAACYKYKRLVGRERGGGWQERAEAQ